MKLTSSSCVVSSKFAAFLLLSLALIGCTKKVRDGDLDSALNTASTGAPACLAGLGSGEDIWNPVKLTQTCVDSARTITSYKCTIHQIIAGVPQSPLTVACSGSSPDVTLSPGGLANGNWQFTVEATNDLGKVGSAPLLFDIDHNPPTVTVTPTLVQSTSATFSIVATEPPSESQVKSKSCYVGTSTPSAGQFTACPADGVFSGLTAATTYELFVVAEDNAGNKSPSTFVASFTTNAVVVPPTCTLGSNSIVAGALNVNYTCGTTNLCSLVNKSTGLAPSFTSTNCGQTLFTSPGIADGIYNFCVRASLATDPVCGDITVDRAGPSSLTITRTDISTNLANIYYTAFDAVSGVKSFKCAYKDMGASPASCGSAADLAATAVECPNNCGIKDTTSSGSVSSCQLLQGLLYNHTYQFVVQAVDNFGNVSDPTSECIVLKDTTTQQGAVVINHKYNGDFVKTVTDPAAPFGFTYSIEPNAALNTNPPGIVPVCTLKNITQNITEFTGSGSTCGPASFSHDIAGDSGDLYSFDVKVSGTAITNTPEDSTTFKLDNSPPVVSIAALDASSYGPTGLTLQFSVSDVHSGFDYSKIECSLVSSFGNAPIGCGASGSFVIPIPYGSLLKGVGYKLAVRATDRVGNVSATIMGNDTFYSRAPFTAPTCSIGVPLAVTSAGSQTATITCTGAANAPLDIKYKYCGSLANGTTKCTSYDDDDCSDGTSPLTCVKNISHAQFVSGPVVVYAYAIDEDHPPADTSGATSVTYKYNTQAPTIGTPSLLLLTDATVQFSVTPATYGPSTPVTVSCVLKTLASQTDTVGAVIATYASPNCTSPLDLGTLGKIPGQWYEIDITATDSLGLTATNSLKWVNGGWGALQTRPQSDHFIQEYKVCDSPSPVNGYACVLDTGFTLASGTPQTEVRTTANCEAGYSPVGGACLATVDGHWGPLMEKPGTGNFIYEFKDCVQPQNGGAKCVIEPDFDPPPASTTDEEIRKKLINGNPVCVTGYILQGGQCIIPPPINGGWGPGEAYTDTLTHKNYTRKKCINPPVQNGGLDCQLETGFVYGDKVTAVVNGVTYTNVSTELDYLGTCASTSTVTYVPVGSACKVLIYGHCDVSIDNDDEEWESNFCPTACVGRTPYAGTPDHRFTTTITDTLTTNHSERHAYPNANGKSDHSREAPYQFGSCTIQMKSTNQGSTQHYKAHCNAYCI